MFHKLLSSPKIITPFLVVASFFAMVALQLYFEETMMAGSGEAIKIEKQNIEKMYEPLMLEAKAKGFKPSGKPGLLVNFWASWCKPCLKEFKSMKKLQGKLNNVSILGVNQDDSDTEMNKVIKRRKLEFFSYRDINTKMADTYGVEEYPYSVFFCKGKIVEIYKGETDFASEDIVKKFQTCK